MTAERKEETGVVQGLQQQLANAFLLYTNYKKYHWQSYGPHFRDLHLLFDEQGEAVLGTIDEMGERVRILGGDPIADVRQFLERGSVTVSSAKQNMREMVGEAHGNAVRVVSEMREAIAVASDANDPGSADLLTRLIQIHEKHEWFLREALKEHDGFSV